MNRILTLGLAAAGTALLSQPVYADHRGGGGGRAAAPAVHSAPAPHFATHSIAPQQHFSMRSAPMPHVRSGSMAQIHPRTSFTPSVAQNRPPRTRNAPSVAFGGTSFNNNAAVNAQNARTFANTAPSAGGGGFRPPTGITRNWQRGSVHEWNHHHYRWYGGDWILFDDAPYGYTNDFGYPDSYYNDNGSEPPPAVMYDSSATIAASVQDRLARDGYDPGPSDGVIGPQTRDAILDFQNDHRLPVTGQIDDPLLRALGLR